MPKNKITRWHNCYEGGWQGIIVPKAFTHPAKMAYGLLKRILAHAKEEDWLKEGQVIVDPFGGIGSTGILGAYEGYQVVCVEVEEKFVDLAHKNFDLHRNAWHVFNCPYPGILQGDSRRLCELIEKADCIVSSPPFCESSGAMAKPETYEGFQHVGSVKHKNNDTKAGYGQTPGQLGSMKPGSIDSIISSPPYTESMEHSGGINPNKSKYKGGPHSQMNRSDTRYGQTPGQLGQEQGETFWQAAKEIVQQCHQILKPGGIAIWVVKSFVRNKAIVDFPGDWKRLCESVGFVTLCEHHAMLVKEISHKTLFGHTEIKRKERKSFFRRLAESKGSPRIDYEVVLCMSKAKGL